MQLETYDAFENNSEFYAKTKQSNSCKLENIFIQVDAGYTHFMHILILNPSKQHWQINDFLFTI